MVFLTKIEACDSMAQAGDCRKFGVASKRAGIYSEHLRAEKGEARCQVG